MKVRERVIPDLLYGTAWKEHTTEDNVARALVAGFRGFDTANQRKHYFEQGVGRALAAALRAGTVTRDQLFVQSKFTFVDGQDDRLPYDPTAPIADQVAQSLRSSLEHLGVERLDSLLLHGPSQRDGLGDADREAWRALETAADSGTVALIGISNVTAGQLAALLDLARVPPAFVQNRCYASRSWDREVRELCASAGIVYQGFSLLTANRSVLAAPRVVAIAASHRRTPAQIVFRFARQLGMLALTGTTDPVHMQQDLATDDFELSAGEVAGLVA